METSREELVFLDTKVHLKNADISNLRDLLKANRLPRISKSQIMPSTQVTRNNPYSVALRVRRNCSDRNPDDKMFIDNMVKYKAYLLESGYASDQIDGHFKSGKIKKKGCYG